MGEAEERASAVYDIFINHRGPDTKKSVASLIYRPLIKYGLRVFLDQDELEAGDILLPAIRSAISSSSVHVAIFSVRYAQSSWCLNELLHMLQSDGKVIPIFYCVKPSDLRYIGRGCYADAFRDHEENGRHDVELVESWKHALRKASEISGMEFNMEEDDFGDLVEEIVERVLKEAKWELLPVAEHPVGLHQATEDFNNFLEGSQLSGTKVVGIIGLDGSGKSTLVKHLYNCYLQNREFKRYCFLSEFYKKDLAVLQQQLVRDLLGDDKCSISDTTKGKRTLQKCLKGCGRVLIVLDGLDKEEQIESLLLVVKKEDVLAEDSLILVTCHDKDLLEGHQVKLFYQVKLLQGKDGRDLFCWNAFDPPKPSKHLEDPPTPPKHLEDLVNKFLEICCGFPLALQVLGRKLYEKQDRRYWEEQLKELSRPKFPKDIVSKILNVIYDDLGEEKQEVFLDVAHFLVGEETDLAVRVLEGLHGSGLLCLKELQSKCLLDLEEIEHFKRPFAKGADIQWRTKGSSKIRMHDLVRKMARQIASEDSCSSTKNKPLRLCQLDDKSILPQLQFKGYHVRGIRWEHLDEPELQDQDIKKPLLPRWPWPSPNIGKPEMIDEEIYGLRLLVLHYFGVSFPSNRLSGNLIWLRMHKSNWANTIPSTLSLRNLRVLELDGVNFEALYRMDGDNFGDFPSKLGELTVDYCGQSANIRERNLPSSRRVGKDSMEASSSASYSVWDWFFTWLPDLVKLILKNVKRVTRLPFDFEALRNLRHLDLSGWSDLENMPVSFTGLLQLQYLALQDCERLSISDLGEITKLEYLDFEGCSFLLKLPDKTTAQRGLRYLNLKSTRILELPEDLGKLKKLEQLLITSPRLSTLPGSFHELRQLRILTLSRSACPSIQHPILISLKNFPYLISLQLRDVRVKIEWDGATDHNRGSPLRELKQVKTDIKMLRIPREESFFPDFEILDLSGSRLLREVESLPCNLRRLYLTYCPSLTTLPCLSNLALLRILDISGCIRLQDLDLEGLRSIEEIAANNCPCLLNIKGLAQLSTLSSLNFNNISTIHYNTNSIWSQILGFPSSVSTVILGGATVLCMNAEEMDSVKQSILNQFQGTTIFDIQKTGNLDGEPLRNKKLYGAILLCFIAKKDFIELKVSVGDNVYSISRPLSFETCAKAEEEHGDNVYSLGRLPSFGTRSKAEEEHEETAWLYTFMWSENSNLFKDLIHGGNFTIELCHGHSGTLSESFWKGWIVTIKDSTDGVKICKQLFNSLCCIIPK